MGGGSCMVAGKKCLFIDVTDGVIDRLDQITSALKEDPATYVAEIPPELRGLLGLSRSV